jgi:integrase
MSSVQPLVDAAGRRRSPAAMPGFRAGKVPRNKGQRYPATRRRAGLRINEALSLTETDLDERRGSVLVRHGKNDRRREVGMDLWGWSALQPWLAERAKLPVGPLFCVIVGPTRGHA